MREAHAHLLDDVVHFTLCHDQDLAHVHDEARQRQRLSGCVLKACAMAGRHCEVADKDEDKVSAPQIETRFWVDCLDAMHFYVLLLFSKPYYFF